jgi:hypothetical protein|tara:strand:- start:935 stop:1105 length:171 start_codon:yes stop_codon:yes gene_type:complete
MMYLRSFAVRSLELKKVTRIRSYIEGPLCKPAGNPKISAGKDWVGPFFRWEFKKNI